MRSLLPFFFLAACKGSDAPPFIDFRSPLADEEFEGLGNLDVRVSISDDRNDAVEVEFFIDGELAGTAGGEDCKRGCQVTGRASTEGYMDGEHELTASVRDSGGNVSQTSNSVMFSIYDVLYVDALTVHDSQESALNGPDIEVEVHVLDDANALWLGCAALPDVQEDDLVYEDLGTPFKYTEEGALRRFTDLALDFDFVRLAVIESDNGDHCPLVPDLTDMLEDDGDQVYGISRVKDLEELFNEDEMRMDGTDFTGLVLKKGRPLNVD